jgi:hypothetical protein
LRAANRLADDYRMLEGDYTKLKSDVDRLKRKNRVNEEAVNKKLFRSDIVRIRPTEDVSRSRSRSRHHNE